MSKPLRAIEFCAISDWCKLHGIKVIEGHSLTIVPDLTPSPELVELRRLVDVIRDSRARQLDESKQQGCNWLIELPMKDDEAKLFRDLTR